MQRTMKKSKIHNATITGLELYYEGSVTIDETLLAAADIRVRASPDRKSNNGERFVSYH